MTAPHTLAPPAVLPGATTTLAVAVVADDPRLVPRVAAAVRREGLVAHVEHGGRAHLSLDGLRRPPDVVVLGVTGHGAATAEAHAIRRRLTEARVVLVLDPEAHGELRPVLDAGIDGIVFANDLDATLGVVVRAVCAGQVCVPRALRHSVDPPALSHRERQILRLVVAGLTNDEIAARLHLATSTVKGTLTTVFRRLGVRSRSEAVAVVLNAGDPLRAVLEAQPGDEGDRAPRPFSARSRASRPA
jgi:DNA-binding NarL/FixJ family response regulator